MAFCAPAFAAPAPTTAHAFSIDAEKASCGEERRIYASCVDQTKIYEAGLAAARAQGKRAIVLLGFNDCPPCNALDYWMKSPVAQALLANYVVVEISIFDPQRHTRAEVYDKIIKPLGLPIANVSPYGVPHLVIVDPVKRVPVAPGVIGFDSEDTSEQVAYLKAHAKS